MADTNTETSQEIATTVDPAMRNSLPIAFRMWAKSINLNLNVCMPCIVEEYDRKSHQATVRPLTLAMSLQNGERFQRAKFKASVWRWQSGGFLIDSPVFKGETGWVVSSDRNATEVKAGNAKIQSPVSYKNKDASNKGPCEIPDGSEETHVFETGFFIPDKWGDVTFQEEYKDALIIRQQNADGTSNGEAVIQPSGEVKVMSHPLTNDGISSKDSTISVKDDVIVIDRRELSHDKERVQTDVVEEDKVTFCTDGIIYDGVPDRTEKVVVAVRYNDDTKKLQVKTIGNDVRGDFIVGVGQSKESEWENSEGGVIKGLDAKVDVSTEGIEGGTEVTLTPNNDGTPARFNVMNGNDGANGSPVESVYIPEDPGIHRETTIGGTATKTITPIVFKVNGQDIPERVDIEAHDGVGIVDIEAGDVSQNPEGTYTVTPVHITLQKDPGQADDVRTVNVYAKNGNDSTVEFDNKSVGPVGDQETPIGLKNYNKEETQTESLTGLLQESSDESDAFPAMKQRLHLVARMIGDDALHTPGDVQYIKLGTNAELKTFTFDDGTPEPPSTKILAEKNITINQKNLVEGPGISIAASGNDLIITNTSEQTPTVGWTTPVGTPAPVIVALQYYNHQIQVKYGYMTVTNGLIKLLEVTDWITITEAVEES